VTVKIEHESEHHSSYPHHTISKLHERVSQHDIEFAELRGVVKTLSITASETKDAIKAINTTLGRTNDLIHAAHLFDEQLMSHIRDAKKEFEAVNQRITEKDEAINKRVDELSTDRKTIAISLILAFVVGFGGMVADFWYEGKLLAAEHADKPKD
jgi:chromosome segregation ATPase